MSLFKQYIAESVKTYQFKIKVAGDLPENFDKGLKGALSKYDCSSVSKGKRIPIQEAPLDFPDMKHTNVTIYDIECRYPVTSQVLAEYLADELKINRGGIRVRSPIEELNNESNLEAMKRVGTNSEALLNQPYENATSEDVASEKAKLNFLKELGKVSATTGEQYKGVNDAILAKSSPTKKSPDTNESIGTTSPVGSKSVKFVDPFKGR